MNPLPPNADELVSAYLDGQAAPDEIVVVESSPELMERVEALRSVADLLHAPLTPPVEQKEAHISAALDAFDAMFASDASETVTEQPTVPGLAVVPAPVKPAEAVEQAAAVTSLSDARERRRPRRFNTGIIAAAAAAVLLFVAVAAFGFGGGDSLDVATSAADTSESASDDAVDAAEGSVNADAESGAALSELQAPQAQAAQPAPTAVEIEVAEAEEAMDDEDAMSDDAMSDDAMDDEEAMADEEELDFDASDDAGASRLSDDPLGFAALRFADQASLLSELQALPQQAIEERASLIEPGLFPGCQQEVDELVEIQGTTLIGQTFIEDQLVEIHQIVDLDGAARFVIVDALDCIVLPPPS